MNKYLEHFLFWAAVLTLLLLGLDAMNIRFLNHEAELHPIMDLVIGLGVAACSTAWLAFDDDLNTFASDLDHETPQWRSTIAPDSPDDSIPLNTTDVALLYPVTNPNDPTVIVSMITLVFPKTHLDTEDGMAAIRESIADGVLAAQALYTTEETHGD